jgi:hypothetical protein
VEAARGDAGELVEGPHAEVASTVRLDGEVTAEEAVAVQVDEPTASRAESRTAASVRRRFPEGDHPSKVGVAG